MQQTEQNNQVRWACRRGMLELDMILQPFFDHRYSSLTSELRIAFRQLLAEPDPDLYYWLAGNTSSAPEAYQTILRSIHDYTMSRAISS